MSKYLSTKATSSLPWHNSYGYPIGRTKGSQLQARIHTCFHHSTEIVQIFDKRYIFNKEKTFQVARLHPRRMELANILSEWLRDPEKGTLGS